MTTTGNLTPTERAEIERAEIEHADELRAMRADVTLPFALWKRAIAIARRRGVTSVSELLLQLLEEAVAQEAQPRMANIFSRFAHLGDNESSEPKPLPKDEVD